MSRLPDDYRAAFVLCCLEGKERSAAARERDDRLLRLQAELDHVRGSLTFRGLRFLDRLLGRGR